MKKCQCCGWEGESDAAMCPTCGEQSFVESAPVAVEAVKPRPSARPKSKES